jgi:exodeoxyribonuclease III
VTLRVMTWNIKTGGYDRGGADRLPAIMSVIADADPDLLAVQELRDFTRASSARLRGFAGDLGMTPVLARSAFGQPVAVLIRRPARVLRSRTVRWRLHHAAAAVTVPTDRGPFTLVSTHLNPFSPRRRAREAVWLARGLARPAGLLMLAGDLNALDPGGDHTDRLSRLSSLYRRRHLRPDGTADTATSAALLAAGYADLWRTAGPADAGDAAGLTAPTTAGGGREFSGMRLDYLLASRDAAALARSCRVLRGGDIEHASDHYPVVADLDLTLTTS